MQQRYIPTLHHLDHSSAFRCLWALEELREANGITYNLRNYRRQRGQAPPELKGIFPMGKSPILTLESTAPNQPPPTIQIVPGVLTEAILILRFLSEEYGRGLWDPESEADANRDAFFQGFATMTLTPQVNFVVLLETIILILPIGISAFVRLLLSPLLSVLRGQLQPAMQILEDALGGGKPYFAGCKFGLADFNVCWGVDMASQRGYFDANKFPKLKNWHATIKDRNGYRGALEKGNGYDLKTFGM